MENYSLSDVAAVTKNTDGMFGGAGGGFFWIFALLLLPMITGGGFFGNRSGGEPVTEAGLCSAMNFNDLENSVGRISDQLNNAYSGLQNGLSQMGYATLQNFGQLSRDLCTGFSNAVAATNSASAQSQSCFAETNRNIDQLRYDGALNAASINANIDAKFAAMEKSQLEQTIAAQQNQINQMYINSQLCGIVRYPMSTTYGAGANPFFGYNGGCCSANI